MEQKKTLWIVAAAGIFLLVVVGAALIIYSPSLHNAPVQQASFDPSTGWVNATSMAEQAQNPDVLPENKNPQETFDPLAQNPNQPQNQNPENTAGNEPPSSNQNAVINAQNVNVYAQETTTFDLNALKAASSSSTNVVARNEKTAEQLEAASVVKSESSKPQENYYTPSTKNTATATKASKSVSSKSSSASSSSKSSSAKIASSKTSVVKSDSAKKVAAASKTPSNLFWVQVGAYSSKKNADAARETLEENKIPVEVFTDNKYFKVRVGPYQTKSEAAYWQKMVGEIGRFADSKTMIVNSAVQK